MVTVLCTAVKSGVSAMEHAKTCHCPCPSNRVNLLVPLQLLLFPLWHVTHFQQHEVFSLCRSRRKEHQETGGGMVLPFDPMTMTFKDLHYYVPIPKVSICVLTRPRGVHLALLHLYMHTVLTLCAAST